MLRLVFGLLLAAATSTVAAHGMPALDVRVPVQPAQPVSPRAQGAVGPAMLFGIMKRNDCAEGSSVVCTSGGPGCCYDGDVCCGSGCTVQQSQCCGDKVCPGSFECCSGGCMPPGATCCNDGTYCDSDQGPQCCGHNNAAPTVAADPPPYEHSGSVGTFVAHSTGSSSKQTTAAGASATPGSNATVTGASASASSSSSSSSSGSKKNDGAQMTISIGMMVVSSLGAVLGAVLLL